MKVHVLTSDEAVLKYFPSIQPSLSLRHVSVLKMRPRREWERRAAFRALYTIDVRHSFANLFTITLAIVGTEYRVTLNPRLLQCLAEAVMVRTRGALFVSYSASLRTQNVAGATDGIS